MTSFMMVFVSNYLYFNPKFCVGFPGRRMLEVFLVMANTVFQLLGPHRL